MVWGSNLQLFLVWSRSLVQGCGSSIFSGSSLSSSWPQVAGRVKDGLLWSSCSIPTLKTSENFDLQISGPRCPITFQLPDPHHRPASQALPFQHPPSPPSPLPCHPLCPLRPFHHHLFLVPFHLSHLHPGHPKLTIALLHFVSTDLFTLVPWTGSVPITFQWKGAVAKELLWEAIFENSERTWKNRSKHHANCILWVFLLSCLPVNFHLESSHTSLRFIKCNTAKVCASSNIHRANKQIIHTTKVRHG